jgi:hypothetical protein
MCSRLDPSVTLRDMKLQFSTSTLLLATAVIAINLAGMGAWGTFAVRTELRYVLLSIGFTAPVWLPFTLIGFAIGRRMLTVRMVVALAIVEAAAVWFARWLQLNN